MFRGKGTIPGGRPDTDLLTVDGSPIRCIARGRALLPQRGCAAVLALLSFLTTGAPAFGQKGSSLVLRKVVFYKNGVVRLRRSGEIVPERPLTLFIPPAQMDYFLKSAIFTDDRGHTIQGLSYRAENWLDQHASSAPLKLTGKLELAGLLNQAPGARIEITRAGRPGTLTGRLIDATSTRKGIQLLLFADNAIRRTPLPEGASVRFLNAEFNRALNRGLKQRLAARLNPDSRITLRTGASRSLVMTYLQRAPVWKTTYRLTLNSGKQASLEGWALINNDSNEDWSNVSVTVAAGRPRGREVSLFAPQYLAPEPEHAISESGFPIPVSTGESALALPPISQIESYVFPHPVSLGAHHGALLPYLSARISAVPAIVFFAEKKSSDGLNAIDLRNTTPATMDGGTVTVFRKKMYLGQGAVRGLASGARQIVTYGRERRLVLTNLYHAGRPMETTASELHISHGRIATGTVRTRVWTFSVRYRGKRLPGPLNLLIAFHRPDQTWSIPHAAAPPYCELSGMCLARFTIRSPRQRISFREQSTTTSGHAVGSGDIPLLAQFAKAADTPAAAQRQIEPILSIRKQLRAAERSIAIITSNIQEQEGAEAGLRENIEAFSLLRGNAGRVNQLVTQLSAIDLRVQQLRGRRRQIRRARTRAKHELHSALLALNF